MPFLKIHLYLHYLIESREMEAGTGEGAERGSGGRVATKVIESHTDAQALFTKM